MFKFLIIACLLVLVGCSQFNAPTKKSVKEVEGSSTERVAKILDIISKYKEPPTVVLDAHFVEL